MKNENKWYKGEIDKTNLNYFLNKGTYKNLYMLKYCPYYPKILIVEL